MRLPLAPEEENDQPKVDVELESEDPSVPIRRPFDPEKIKVKTVPLVVEQLVSRIRHEEIDLSPEFQRLRGVWDERRKSRLIESLLLRIPLPVFYVAADQNENWSVVDGLQRMSTIYDFVCGEFALNQLEYLTQLNGVRWDPLPRPMKRRISETQLLVHVIEPGTPEEVMFNIFSRINTGGMRLNGQEIRHALHKGPVRTFLKELAETEEFIQATDGAVSSKRMADRECVLRFLAFYINPWEEYSANDLDGYLGSAMDKVNGMSETQRASLTEKFKKAMTAAADIFGVDAFRKRYDPAQSRNPVSKALLEAWSVQLARCTQSQIQKLSARKEDVRRAFIQLMRNDRDFEAAISYSTGSPQRVLKRFNAIKTLIEEYSK